MRQIIIGLLVILSAAIGTPAAAAPAAPTLTGPPDASTLGGFTTILSWTNPSLAIQVHLQVTPYSNDGPGVNLILSGVSSFTLPPPPHWYGLLPDMEYSWRTRASDAPTSVGVDDSSWGAWSSVWTFRTPTVTGTVAPVTPIDGAMIGSDPVLRWSDANPNIFYYELQVSSDNSLNTDPETATAAVWHLLLHGGVTTPQNSYRAAGLQPGTKYYWRVRPRVQGDGHPVDWSKMWSFAVPTLSGRGQTATNPITPPAPVSTATFTHDGNSNFVVWAYRGNDRDLLVNEIGRYQGTRPILGTAPVVFDIEADGAWTITIAPLRTGGSSNFSGRGDSVSSLFEPPGSGPYEISHDGRSNFVMWLRCADRSSLVQNEIGPVNASRIITFGQGPCYWEVVADGSWAVAARS